MHCSEVFFAVAGVKKAKLRVIIMHDHRKPWPSSRTRASVMETVRGGHSWSGLVATTRGHKVKHRTLQSLTMIAIKIQSSPPGEERERTETRPYLARLSLLQDPGLSWPVVLKRTSGHQDNKRTHTSLHRTLILFHRSRVRGDLARPEQCLLDSTIDIYGPTRGLANNLF